VVLAKYLPSKREHPIKAAAVLTCVIYAPAIALMFLLMQKSVLFITAFSVAFIVVMFNLLIVAVKWDNRSRAARDRLPADSALSISDALLGEPWSRRLTAFAIVGTVTVSVGLLIAVFTTAFGGEHVNTSTTVLWLIVSVVLANELCRMRERQLARALREWSEITPTRPLAVWATDGSRKRAALLDLRDATVALSFSDSVVELPRASVAVGPGAHARFGSQEVRFRAGAFVIVLTPVTHRDPACWPHIARRPRPGSSVASPMWELIRVVQSNPNSQAESSY